LSECQFNNRHYDELFASTTAGACGYARVNRNRDLRLWFATDDRGILMVCES
jgi:hypothetical protein